MILLNVSQEQLQISMILAQGWAAFIQTPRLALLQILLLDSWARSAQANFNSGQVQLRPKIRGPFDHPKCQDEK